MLIALVLGTTDPAHALCRDWPFCENVFRDSRSYSERFYERNRAPVFGEERRNERREERRPVYREETQRYIFRFEPREDYRELQRDYRQEYRPEHRQEYDRNFRYDERLQEPEQRRPQFVRRKEVVPVTIAISEPRLIVVSLEGATATAYRDGAIAFENGIPLSGTISSGTAEHPTPLTEVKRGPQVIGRRSVDHVSNLYPIPYGGAKMPYAQFLSYDGKKDDAIAFHVGQLDANGAPLSHGCIRLSMDMAQRLWRFYDATLPIRVIVVRNFDEFRQVWVDGYYAQKQISRVEEKR